MDLLQVDTHRTGLHPEQRAFVRIEHGALERHFTAADGHFVLALPQPLQRLCQIMFQQFRKSGTGKIKCLYQRRAHTDMKQSADMIDSLPGQKWYGFPILCEKRPALTQLGIGP